MRHGFIYLAAVIDWHSRYVLSWELSNTMENLFCVEALEGALRLGQPEIFNTDPRVAVHVRGVHGRAVGQADSDQHGWRERALDNAFIE
jgi:putative transposase